ncbi:MAG: hypothetical protein DYH02_16660, partial [Candidatus Omnitrophica bacterium COP1]|nr:hypothetical protein [Candidatus Omnitrophica bacterium COP1]
MPGRQSMISSFTQSTDTQQKPGGIWKKFQHIGAMVFVLLLVLGATAQAQEEDSPVDPELLRRHPSAWYGDPNTFKDIGDVNKADLVFFDGRRQIALTLIDDMAVVRLKGRMGESLPLGEIPSGSKVKSLDGARNTGWNQVADACVFTGLSGKSSLLKSDPNVDVIFPVYQVGTTSWGLTDRIAVRFLPGTDKAQIEALFKKYNLTPMGPPDDAAGSSGYDLLLKGASGEDALLISNALAGETGVDYSSPDWLVQYVPFFTPNDPLYVNQWHLRARRAPALAEADLDAEGAWDTTRGRGIRVCVIDSAVDYDHEDLKIVTENGVQIGYDPLQRDNDPRPIMGDSAHGTSVAGVIAAIGNNRKGVSGVASEAEIMGVRLITGGFLLNSQIRDSFLFALREDAAVCNNSWGSPWYNNFCSDLDDKIENPLSPTIRDGLERLIKEGRQGLGCVVVFAAGNSRANVDGDELNAHPGVVCVAASNNLAKRSHYSNYGSKVDVSAPSNDFFPTWTCASRIWTGGTLGISTTDIAGASGYSTSDYTNDFGGTSSAAPAVAGVAALVIAKNPNLTRQAVQKRMEGSADKIDSKGGQYNVSGHSLYYGYGKVNAA